ncbi:TetR/AcrR family transcriptional regulator [Paenibacillus arenilitoris]|uniref:WHG domain-containing protein n=1 Tax=Paenibacillus arenilitoris TaxID=2772299 RepID=A0A927CJT9_9BACL|nr:TetR/AcrR family transcriptional regulator [Paenibacillus arenilitoris]MBD2868042.1 WHG domain-containing protein [Paenibacillus arenilitoris]
MSPRKGLDMPTIVEAAAQIADESGIEEVTLASLAQKLGIRSPSLYNHVNGLGGLRAQLALHGLKKLTEALTVAVEGREGDERMHALAAAYMTFARTHPGLYELTLRAPGEDDAEHSAAAAELLELLVQALAFYELDREKSIHIVRGFRSYLHGFASIERQGGFGLPQSVDESIKLVLQTYLAGLRQL